MIDVNRGDVVLLRVQLPGRQDPSLRPALVVSSQTYHRGRGSQVVVAAITGDMKQVLTGDSVIQGWRDAGLLAASAVTGVLRTVGRDTVAEKLGALSEGDLRSVDNSLRLSLAI